MVHSSATPIPDSLVSLLLPFPFFQVSFIQASFDGLITGPVKGQVHQIGTEHRHTGETLEDNPTITLPVFEYPNAALLWSWHVK